MNESRRTHIFVSYFHFTFFHNQCAYGLNVVIVVANNYKYSLVLFTIKEQNYIKTKHKNKLKKYN